MAAECNQNQLWADLELAVRTPAEQLAVDALLPDPREQVERFIEKRAEKKKPIPQAEPSGVTDAEESLSEIMEEVEEIEAPRPVNEAKALEDELRNQLSGNDFADFE